MSLELLAAAREIEWREVPRLAVEMALEKLARSPMLQRLGEVINLFPSKYPTGIPGTPSPLAGMLSGGLLGAGLGYGAGALGEKLLPEDWEEGRLSRTLALTGGLLGAAPGALFTGLSAAGGHNVLGPWPFGPDPKPKAIKPAEYAAAAAAMGVPVTQVEKYAHAFGPYDPAYRINPYFVNQLVWEDPWVSPGIPLPIRAATSGMLESARHLNPGGPSSWVTPHDLGRLAAGMGVGYAAGTLVGKALGVLTGMPPATQAVLRNSGMYAGMINAIVPRMFGALQ